MGKVNRCICNKISFDEIQKIAGARDFSSVKELREHGICATNCRLCEPYIARLLQTGKTEFEPKAMFQSHNE